MKCIAIAQIYQKNKTKQNKTKTKTKTKNINNHMNLTLKIVNKKLIIWIRVLHCGIVWFSYCPSRQYVAESGNIAWLNNRPGLMKPRPGLELLAS